MERESTAKRLREAMERYGMRQIDLAKKTGIGKSAISQYLSGKILPKQDKLFLLGKVLHVSPTWLMGFDVPMDFAENPVETIPGAMPIKTVKVPVIGTIAAGAPIYADQHVEAYVPCDGSVHADFALKVKGDSMVGDGINDGDIVFIRLQPMVENGQIAAVLINDEATLKHVYISANSCTLVSSNPKYSPMTFDDSNCDVFRIIGIAVARYSLINQ